MALGIDPVVWLPIAEALPVLPGIARQTADPAAAFWAAAGTLALDLVARARIVPGVSAAGFAVWRAGPLDPEDIERIRRLAAAMPPGARAASLPDRIPLGLPDAEGLVHAFLDAVADVLPRLPTEPGTTAPDGAAEPFAVMAARPVPELRGWAVEVAAALDPGIRVSLVIEMAGDGSGLRLRPEHFQSTMVGTPSPLDTLLALRRAAQLWTPLERLLDGPVPDAMTLADEDVVDLLGEAGPRLAAGGVDVRWAAGLDRNLSASAVITTPAAAPTDLPGLFGGAVLADAQPDGGQLSLDWRLALAGNPLTDAEMDRLAEAYRPVVRLRDRWVLLSPELARKARERAGKPLGALDALGAALTGTVDIDGERVEVAANGWLDALRRRIAEPERQEPVAPPPALHATLRGYQLRGLRWLGLMTSLGLGACLADDMGLGKTVTLIALHLHRQADPATTGPTLVVCPASLLGNWEREIHRFAPGTPVRRYHGAGRSLAGLPSGGFVLTTYGTMRLDAEVLAAGRWTLVVADEAQHVKNHASGTARALRTIPAAARVALTGTPIENNLAELWAIVDWTTPGLLGTLSGFRARWAAPIEAGDPVAAQRLSRLIRPFLLRRRKSDPGIAPELPAKTETDRPVPLTEEQAGLYQAVVRETMAQIRASSGMARRGLILKLVTALKQICNHPAQYLGESDPEPAGRSGKLELLDELLDTILAEDGAVLVFTQYVAMARLIERHLAGRGVPVQLLHGGTPVPRRDELVRRFQEAAAGDGPVFLLSLKAAGTGLNLTRAEHVVHFDRWWNPAVEAQATDRAYRIGQTRPVQVHRLIAEGTIEDRIAELLAGKRELADAVLGATADERAEAAPTELSDAALADLVGLRSRE